MFKQVSWIFFDVGSTLVDESIVYENRFRKISELVDVPYEHIREIALKFYEDNQKGDIEVAKYFDVDLPPWDCFEEKLYDDAASCLEMLHKRYKIGIIANQIKGTKERLENYGILKYFDLILASAELGISKPDKRIFELALEKSSCQPCEAVMVGDRIDNDIVPAKKIGMKTIWIRQGFGGLWKISKKEEMPDLEIKELSELCNVL